MAYDEELADRVRGLLLRHEEFAERKMFGGICFMLNGNMCCGVANDDLMVRLGPERGDAALGEAHVRPMDFTGKPMRGYAYVDAAGTSDEVSLAGWVERCVAFCLTLPPKRHSVE
jgi:TfoX/Sxy family transcriptional regulator of competence genes